MDVRLHRADLFVGSDTLFDSGSRAAVDVLIRGDVFADGDLGSKRAMDSYDPDGWGFIGGGGAGRPTGTSRRRKTTATMGSCRCFVLFLFLFCCTQSVCFLRAPARGTVGFTCFELTHPLFLCMCFMYFVCFIYP